MVNKSFMNWVHEWNTKLYWNEDGTRAKPGFQAEEFWDEFKIKSWPKFQDACAYHIPSKWVYDVRIFVKQVQDELKDRIAFAQIKEKFCRLTVYFNATDEEARTRAHELIQECIDRLINKGVHPPKQEMEE